MSFVECMECGDQLKCIAPAHLRRHGLTSKEYRDLHPTAPMVSDETRRKHDLTLNGEYHRNCRKCGKPFSTRGKRSYYCLECQRVRDILTARRKARRYYRKMRNSGKPYKMGTFEKGYLEVAGGRVRGAILLEKHVSINGRGFYRLHRSPFNGKAPFRYEETHVITIYLIIWNRKIFCGECGSQLTVARENEYYTIPAEICCRSCGLVYDFATL